MRIHKKSTKKNEASRAACLTAQISQAKYVDLADQYFHQRDEKGGPATDVEFVNGKLRLVYGGS